MRIKNVVYSFRGAIEKSQLAGIIENMDKLAESKPLDNQMSLEKMTRHITFENYPSLRYVVRDMQKNLDKTRAYRVKEGESL